MIHSPIPNNDYTPSTIQVELVEGCNRRCAFCGVSKYPKDHKKTIKHQTIGAISHLIHNYLGQTPKPKCTIYVAMHGEPTLHPNYLSCLKQLSNNGKYRKHLRLLTNGFSLNDIINTASNKLELMDILLDEVSQISRYVSDIGIDLYSHDTDALIGYLNILSTTHPQLIHIINEDQNKHFMARPSNIPKDALCIHLIPNITQSKRHNRRVVNHAGAISKLPNPMKKPCTKPFRELVFRYDGSIGLCCDDFLKNTTIAYLYETPESTQNPYWIDPYDNSPLYTIEELFNAKAFKEVRSYLYYKNRSMKPCCWCNTEPVYAHILSKRDTQKPYPTPEERAFYQKPTMSIQTLEKLMGDTN